jgi:hypothetical protein
VAEVQVEGAVRTDEPPRLGQRQADLAEQHQPLVLTEDAQGGGLFAAAHRSLAATEGTSPAIGPL